MAAAPSPNDLTRQQLDELDALLQRMLAVPLAPSDTPMPAAAPVPTPPSWRIDPPPTASVSSPHLLFPESPPPVAPRLDLPPPGLAPAPPVAAAPFPTARAAQYSPPSPPVTAPPVPPVATSKLTSAPASPPLPFVALPFVLVNMLFDAGCGLFGPPGRLLRSAFFKYLYGLAGVLLLLYTAVHVAQENRWLTLPITLPWPAKLP